MGHTREQALLLVQDADNSWVIAHGQEVIDAPFASVVVLNPEHSKHADSASMASLKQDGYIK